MLLTPHDIVCSRVDCVFIPSQTYTSLFYYYYYYYY